MHVVVLIQTRFSGTGVLVSSIVDGHCDELGEGDLSKGFAVRVWHVFCVLIEGPAWPS